VSFKGGWQQKKMGSTPKACQKSGVEATPGNKGSTYEENKTWWEKRKQISGTLAKCPTKDSVPPRHDAGNVEQIEKKEEHACMGREENRRATNAQGVTRQLSKRPCNDSETRE